MILEDVGMVARSRGDPDAPPGFGARIMRITTDAGSFETPARILSASEHRARSEVSISKALPHDLAIDFRPLRTGDAAGLVNDSRVADRLIRTARQFESCTRRATLRLTVFQPPASDLKGMSAEDKILFADAQADVLEKNLGAGIVVYPYLGLDARRYERFINDRYRRNQACMTLFTLDMGMAPAALEKILKKMADKNEPAIIPLIYKSPDRTVPQHRILARYLDSPRLALLACQVPRTVEIGGQAVSGPHAAAIVSGYDMVALRQYPPPRAAAKPNLDKIAFFTTDTLQVEGIRRIMERGDRDLAGEFGLNENNGPDRKHIGEILGGFEGAGINRKKFRQLHCLARVHEAINSPPEFERMHEMIAAGRFGLYASATLAAAAAAYAPGGPAQTLMPDFFGLAEPPAAPGQLADAGGTRDGNSRDAA